VTALLKRLIAFVVFCWFLREYLVRRLLGVPDDAAQQEALAVVNAWFDDIQRQAREKLQ